MSHHPDWVADAVFYQIFPDRFASSPSVAKPRHLEPWDAPPTVHGYKGGDLVGIADHLDYLSDLGITAIYLNPIFQSGSNHRYHTHDYFHIDPLLGGDEAFRVMLEACRDRSIRVVLDGVLNHASRGFYQFHDLLESGDQSPWADWFTIEGWPLSAYTQDGSHRYLSWRNLPALPKFNTDNPEVREFLMGVGEHWVRRGIDGWRLDVPTEITTPGFWEEFRDRTKAINPELYIVGEIWADASGWTNAGDRFDGTMNYWFGQAAISFGAAGRIVPGVADRAEYDLSHRDAPGFVDEVRRILDQYSTNANLSHLNLLGSHDVPRLLTVAGGDRATVELATTLLLTYPGAPSIYYGDEIGMTGGMDPGCRAGFPWDGEWDAELLETHRSLIALRRAHPALRSLDYELDAVGNDAVVIRRRGDDEQLVVAVNAGDEPASLPGSAASVLWGDAVPTAGSVTVPARSAAIWAV